MEIGHADLKLENILVDDFSGKLSVVLADFGRSDELRNTLLKISKGVNTTTYSAPETFDDRQCLKSDVYSYALIVWELFKRKRVDFGKSMQAIFTSVVIKHETTFANMLKNLPADQYALPDVICDLLPQCWAKNPSSCLTAQQTLHHLEAIAHEFGDLSPLEVPPPYKQSTKPVASYIRALEKKAEVTAANIDPLEVSERKWRREKIMEWCD
jgi:serine/threonine protein kinase